MAKLKLPFELEKPSSNEYVTQSSEIGHNGEPLADALSPLDNIDKQSTQSEEQAVVFETDGGVQVGKIDANGANFTNLKRGGQQVARMSDLPTVPTLDTSIGSSPSDSHTPSTKAVKDYVDANSGVGDLPISEETTQSEEEEFVASNDAGTDTYAKVGSYGIKAKEYLDLNGNKVFNPTFNDIAPISMGANMKVGVYINGSYRSDNANYNCMMLHVPAGTYFLDFFYPVSNNESVDVFAYGSDKKTVMSGSSVCGNRVYLPNDGYIYMQHWFKITAINRYPLTFYSPYYIHAINTTSQTKDKQAHKVLWLGTSIPTGDGHRSRSYPEWVCINLGVGLEKHTQGESRMTTGNIKTLTDTIAEKTASYSGQTAPDEKGQQKAAPYFSYENLVIPYLDGTNASCDIIIYEHGYNDYAQLSSSYTLETTDDDINWQSQDRTDYVGAFNYLYQKILEVSPLIRMFVTSSTLEKSSTPTNGNNYGALISHINKLIAEHYGLPYIDIAGELGWAKNIAMPNSSSFLSDYNATYGTNYPARWTDSGGNISIFQYFCPDGIHPHSDARGADGTTPKGLAMPRIIECLTSLLKNRL